jgi:hypothetical protein
MKLKMIFALCFLLIGQTAFANISCEGSRGHEVVEVTIYDTLVGISAKITRRNPVIQNKITEIFVTMEENNEVVAFVNAEANFAIAINKTPRKPSPNPKYEASFEYKDFFGQVICSTQDI